MIDAACVDVSFVLVSSIFVTLRGALSSQMSCPNAVAPLQLSWNNITVSSDGSALTNGIGIQLGTPSQVRRRPSASAKHILTITGLLPYAIVTAKQYICQ